MSRWSIHVVAIALGIYAAAGSAAGQDKPGPVYPNLLVEVSSVFMNATAKQEIDQNDPISRQQGKATITGQQISHADVGTEFLPSGDGAIVELLLRGRTDASTMAAQGPVRLFLTTRLSYVARKRIRIDENGILDLGPACSNPNLDRNSLDYLCTKLRGPLDPLVRRIASRSFYKKKPQLDQDVLSEARKQVEKQFDETVLKQLADANLKYDKEYRKVMKDRGIWPQRFRFLTSDTQIGVRALLYDPALASPPTFAPVPEIIGTPDLALRIEESFPTRATHGIFAGKTFTGDELNKEFNKLFKPIGNEVDVNDPGDKPFTITFPKDKPMEFHFDKQIITITIRGEEFTSGDTEYDGMNTTGIYKLRRTARGFIAERQGELEIYPPGFVKGKDKLGAREQVLRKLLERKFGKVLKSKFEMKGQELIATQAEADKGWLTIGMREPTEAEKK